MVLILSKTSSFGGGDATLAGKCSSRCIDSSTGVRSGKRDGENDAMVFNESSSGQAYDAALIAENRADGRTHGRVADRGRLSLPGDVAPVDSVAVAIGAGTRRLKAVNFFVCLFVTTFSWFTKLVFAGSNVTATCSASTIAVDQVSDRVAD